MRGTLRWIAGGLASAIAVIALARIELSHGPDVHRLDHVELAPVEGDSPPPRGSPSWRAARLPWDWSPRGDGRDVWCRAELRLASAPSEPLQLLVAQVAFGADVFVNGQLVAVVGRGPSARWGRRELAWLPISARDLRAGPNEILLRLQVRPEFAGFLTPLFVGPPTALQGSHRVREIIVSGLRDVLVVASATLALLYFSVYRRMRGSEWAWLTLGLGVVALGGLPVRPVDYLVWPLAVDLATTCVICAAHRGGGIARPGLERAGLAAIGVLATASLLAPASARYALGLLAASYALISAIYLISVYRTESVARWLTNAMGLPTALGLATLLALADTPLYWRGAPLLGVPLFPVVHLPILVASFVQVVGFLADGLARSNELNRSLQESQARLLALERAQAAREERERLQRDLHDGLGAQLVAALAAAEREPRDPAAVQQAVRLALGELRGAVDSLDGGDAELAAVLGALRARLEPLVASSHATLGWRIASDVPDIRLDPQRALHLLRILQEAIANAVKHAGARSIEVSSGPDSSDGRAGAFVEVRDDGRGLAEAGAGRGLANMRQRASFLGGELTLMSSTGGTSVRLWLPVPTPSA